jgi:hypothetical protein
MFPFAEFPKLKRKQIRPTKDMTCREEKNEGSPKVIYSHCHCFQSV